MVVMLGQQQRRRLRAERGTMSDVDHPIDAPVSTVAGHESSPHPTTPVDPRDAYATWPEWCVDEVATPRRDGVVGKYGERFGSNHQHGDLSIPASVALIRQPLAMGRGSRQHYRLRYQHRRQVRDLSAHTRATSPASALRPSSAMQALVAAFDLWWRDIRDGDVVARRTVAASITALVLVISTVGVTLAG